MSLAVWLPLNGDLTNQGLSGLTAIYNSGAIVNNNGKIGKCYSFTTSQLIQVTLPSQVTSPVGSLSCWVKFNSFPASGAYLCLLKLGNVGSGHGSSFLSLWIAGSNIYVVVKGKDPASADAAITNPLSTNTWYHLTITYDGTIAKIYSNGIQIYSKSLSGGSLTNANYLLIGASNANTAASPNPNYGLSGYLNDVRYYDHALSAQEVKKLAQGLILHYPLNYHNINLLKLTGPERSCSSQSATILHYYYDFSSNLPSGTYTFSFDAKSSNGTDSCYVSYASNDSTINRIATLTNIPTKYTHYSYTFTNSASNCNNIFFTSYKNYGSPTNQNNTGTLYIKNIKLENGNDDTGWICAASELSNTTVYDISGYKNHGTVTGSLTAAADTPRYKSSTQYPDSACAIGIGNLSTMVPEGNFTFNIWFKKITNEWSSKNYETILGGPSGFELEMKKSGTNSPMLQLYSWGGGTVIYTLDEWHMLTMVRTSSDSIYYIDGVQVVTGTAGTIPSGDYFIGAWKTATQQNYRGYFSDARIYATALSADDVAELYALGSA